MPKPLNSIWLSLIASFLSVAAFGKGGPSPCGPVSPTPNGWLPPTKLHLAGPNGTAPYGTSFGVQVAARKAEIGGLSVAVVAVGSFDTKKIEVFFLDAGTGGKLDGGSIGTVPLQPHISLPMPDWIPGATIMKMGDVNSDFRPDVVVSLRGQGNVAIFLANGSGALTYPSAPVVLPQPSPAPLGTYPYNLAVGNLAGDEGDEIAVTARGTASGKNVMPDKVHLFQWSAGSLTNYRTIVAPAGSGVIASLAMGDLIGGTAPDLAISDPKADVNGVRDAGRVYLYNGDSPDFSTFFSISPETRDQLFGVEIGIGKIKGSPSFSDLVSATFANLAYVYPAPLDLAPIPDILAAGQANSLATGDVNGDFLADLVVGDPFSCSGAGAAYVFLSQSGPPPVPLPIPEKSYVLGPPEIVGPSSGIGFGFRVQAVDGTQLLIISAKSIPVGSNGSGQVYVYQVN